MTPKYIDSAAAAEMLGFGTGKQGANAIRQRIHRGELPHYKIGTRLRFKVSELDTWMERHRVKVRQSADMETPL